MLIYVFRISPSLPLIFLSLSFMHLFVVTFYSQSTSPGTVVNFPRSLPADYLTGPTNPHHEDLLKTVQQLQADRDRDVRYFVGAGPASQQTHTSLPHEHSTPDTLPV